MGSCGSWRTALAPLAIACCFASGAAASEPSLLGRPVRAIRFVSDAPVDEEGLRRLLPLRVGEPLTSTSLADAQQLLEAKQIFRRVAIEPVEEAEGVALEVRLERKDVVGAVRVTGHGALSDTETRRLIRLSLGMVLEPGYIEAAQQRLRDHYQKIGYPDAQVGVEVETEQGEADIDFRIVEGEPVVVAAVVVDGDPVVGTGSARRALGKLEGRVWTREVQREARRILLGELRDTGYYEARVASAWEPSSGKRGVLRLTVAAGPPFIIEIDGNRRKSRKKLLGQLSLRDRLIITDGTWRELARRMEHAYQEAGYYRVEVRVEIADESPKRVRFSVREGRKYVLRRIVFAGNHLLSDAELRRGLATRPARWFPWPRRSVLLDDVLDDDLKRLWFLYRHRGFESAEIVDAPRQLDEAQGTIDLTIVIEEGPRTIVRDVRRDGLAALGDGPSGLRVAAGKALDPDDVSADRRAMLAALGRLGYADAALEAVIDRVAGGEVVEATVTWSAQPNRLQRIGTVVVQGNIDTRDRVIMRELPFVAGQPMDPEVLLTGQSKVYQLGLFRSVSVRPFPAAGESVRDVGVQVVERAPGKLEWGAGFNTRDGFGAFAEIGYDNLGGMARRVSARAAATLDPANINDSQYLGTLGFREPRLAESLWQLQTNLIGERSTRSVDQFSLTRGSLVTSVDRELRPRTRGGVELQIERSFVFDVEPDAQLTQYDEGLLWTVAPSVFVVYDGRDDRFNPQRGVVDSARVRYAIPEVSTVNFVKVTVQHSQYVSLGSGVVLLGAARGGWGLAFNGGGQLPIRERFFLGGRTTVRGFSENDIGPTGADKDPIGGDLALNLNLELRFPIAWGFGGAVFVDGGGVYLQDADPDVCEESCAISLKNFRRSAGIGLRYQTPIGPVSLDYGVKLDRRVGESFGEIHFSIGNIF